MNAMAEEWAQEWRRPGRGDTEEFLLQQLVVAGQETIDDHVLAMTGGLVAVFAACRARARWERTGEKPTLLRIEVKVTAA